MKDDNNKKTVISLSRNVNNGDATPLVTQDGEKINLTADVTPKWLFTAPILSLVAILVFTIGYAIHVKYDLRFESVTNLISSPYIREPVVMFLYLGAWMSTCIIVIVSRFMPVKKFWFWQLFILLGMSLSSSLILTKASFGELSLSRVFHWFLSYSTMLLIINVPVLFLVYATQKRKRS